MSIRTFLLILGIILLVGIGVFYITSRTQTNGTAGDQVPEGTNAPAPTIDIPEDWTAFTSSQYGFSLMYPPDINQETTLEGERFYKLGPSQVEGTELYDGISVTISSGSLNGQTLETFVNRKHTETESEPLEPQVSEIQPVTIANLSGFRYNVRSIGDAEIIFLPKGEGEYLQIVNYTVEPQNREQTFQAIVDRMLSTIQVEK